MVPTLHRLSRTYICRNKRADVRHGNDTFCVLQSEAEVCKKTNFVSCRVKLRFVSQTGCLNS